MEHVTKFFEKFADDFSQFDGMVISNKYLVPYLAVDSNGDMKYLNSKNEISKHFQNYLDNYREQGVVSCSFENLECFKIGECVYIAIVTWVLCNKEGNSVLSWRESYNLLEKEKNVFVYSSADYK